MRSLLLIVLLALALMAAGCTTKPAAPVTPAETVVTTVATPAPAPTLTPRQAGVDPIIGAWDNGMVFKAGGAVGDSGTISWRANDMVEYSYFVTTETRAIEDKKGGSRIDPTASSIEWIYNPYSDTIHIRDTSIAYHRVVPGSVPPAPVTTAAGPAAANATSGT